MAVLDKELADAIRARLRYYRDLGVYDFYRNGESVPLEAAEIATSVRIHTVEPEKETETVTETAIKIAASAEPVPPSAFPADLPEPEMPPRKPISPALSMPVPAEVVPAAAKAAALEAIRTELGECTRCSLAFLGRNKIVFGDGTPNTKLMFVGEGPGADEDAQGLPFVGRAGQLLNNMINAMGLKREEVYIANIVKCRPPQNRVPEPEEANTCSPFLFRQIDVIRPEVIVALGATAATYLLGRKSALNALRGSIHEARGSKLIVTYHPAYLLRDPNQKKEAWKDLQIAMKELGLKPAAKA